VWLRKNFNRAALELAEKDGNALKVQFITRERPRAVANMPHAFKDRDVQRLIKAARSAGLDPASVTVDLRRQRITVHSKSDDAAEVDAPPEDNADRNPWDEVLSNAADEKRPA
jgi:hypothetical protein